MVQKSLFVDFGDYENGFVFKFVFEKIKNKGDIKMKSQIKKIFAVLVCVCMMLSVVVISASADSAATEIVLTVDSLGLGDYGDGTKTVDGAEFEWIQLGNYNNGGIQVRDKNGNTSSLWNTAAFSAPIKEIKLVYSDSMAVYDNPNCAIYSFGNAAGTYTYETKLSTVAGTKEYTITPDAETYTFFKFEHDLGYTHYWKSITIVLADGTTGGGAGEGGSGDGDEGAGGTTPPPASEPEYELVDTPEAGVAYKFGMIQGNVSTEDVYYLIGGMDGYYMATGTEGANAIDVYLEETTGGYYLYTMVGGVKTYINMVVSGTHVNGVYEEAADTVYTYDTESKTVIAIVEDAPYWFGTRNDKTYTTVGPCKTEYEGFYCQFYVEKKASSGTVGGGTDTDAGAGTGTGTGTGTGSNNTTKPIPVTNDANVVVMMVVMAVAAASVFAVAKLRKN